MAKSKSKAKPKTKKSPSASGDNFLILHGEKFAFALIIFLGVFLIIKGTGLAPFNLTADMIKNSAQNAENHIKNNEVPIETIDDSLKIFDYNEYAKLIRSSLKIGMYATTTRWDQSLFPEKIPRPDIVPLCVENLKAVAGVGAIRYYDEKSAANANPNLPNRTNANIGIDRGCHWITITGLIPIAKELKDYDDKLRHAQFTDINRDIPKYISYDIERGTKGENGEIVWEKIDLAQVYETQVDQWAGYGVDPVPVDFTVPSFSDDAPSLTMPCPPIVNKVFGEEVTYLPTIPLLSDLQRQETAKSIEEAKKLEEETKRESKRDFSSIHNQPIFQRQGSNANKPGLPLAQENPQNRSNLRGANQRRSNLPMIGGGSQNQMITLENKVDYYLFRHFDFDVQENVTYYYRVKLYLANPNYGLDSNLVENADSTSKITIVSDFCAPSNPVSLGNNSRILVENVQPAVRADQEPQITVASIFFNEDDAQESIAADKKVVRGQVANFMGMQHNPVSLSGAGITQGNQGGKKNKTSVNHESNICILDAEGGHKINGTDLISPSQMLVLSPSGVISLHSASKDSTDLAPYRNGARR